MYNQVPDGYHSEIVLDYPCQFAIHLLNRKKLLY